MKNILAIGIIIARIAWAIIVILILIIGSKK